MDLLSKDFFNFYTVDLPPSPSHADRAIEEEKISKPSPLSLGAQATIEAAQDEWEAKENAET